MCNDATGRNYTAKDDWREVNRRLEQARDSFRFLKYFLGIAHRAIQFYFSVAGVYSIPI